MPYHDLAASRPHGRARHSGSSWLLRVVVGSEPLALVLGLSMFALGVGAWADAGFTFTQPLEHVTIMGLHATPLMAMLTVVFAIAVTVSAAAPGGDRFGLLFTGALALGFGIVVLITPDPMHHALGVHVTNGLLAAVCGLLLLEASFDTPRPWRRRL